MKSVIECENLSFRYRTSGKDVLCDIHFEAGKGEILGFLGPSGAGKSTLQKLMTGSEQGYRGTLRFSGEDISSILKKGKKEFYRSIGIQFEVPGFYNRFTARENLNLFSSLYSVKTENADELAERLGLRGDLDRRTAEFSKGMQIRLDLIRSLLHSPELLFLDEPTAGLDPVSVHLVAKEILRRKEQGVTVILTTHDMHLAETICDRTAFLFNGRMAALDSPGNLMLSRSLRKVKVTYNSENGRKTDEFPLDDLGENQEFLHLLKTQEVCAVHSEEPDLGQIFREITGGSLL